MSSRRWASMPVGAGRRKVSPSAALKSLEVNQGAAALWIAAEWVRRAGAAGASLLAVSVAKTTRRGVAKSAGDSWSRVVFTLSMVAPDFLMGMSLGSVGDWGIPPLPSSHNHAKLFAVRAEPCQAPSTSQNLQNPHEHWPNKFQKLGIVTPPNSLQLSQTQNTRSPVPRAHPRRTRAFAFNPAIAEPGRPHVQPHPRLPQHVTP